MKNYKDLTFKLSDLVIPLLWILAIWFVYWVEVTFGFSLNSYGIRARTFVGLRGILFSPFIHGSVGHLWSNSLPLLILSMALLYFYKPIAWKVLIFGGLFTGGLTWVIAESGTHIGASGIVYLLASFLFFKGISSKNYRLMALSLIVVFVYGGLAWGVFPGEKGISWEGHLSGAISGGVFAWFFRNYNLIPEKKYSWERPDYKEEEDEFMKHFDEDGNFVPSPSREEETDEFVQELPPLEVRYHYIPSEKKKDD